MKRSVASCSHSAYNPLMDIKEYLGNIDYPGRVVAAGWDECGYPILFYAITGRSGNSRNRILVSENGTVKTRAYDESKVEDPSLIIYTAFKSIGSTMIITNGDHTDTIAEYLEQGKSLEDAIASRTYEPDSPSYTPRIGAVVSDDSICFFIIKRDGDAPLRIIWKYEKENGILHLIHTYERNGNPLPSFSGNPVRLEQAGEMVLEDCWNALKREYHVSAFIRTSAGERIINALEDLNG